MRVSEIFHSIQGEGKLTGMPSAFIRLAGCNLHCRYCDTPYALNAEDGREMSIAQILSRIHDFAAGHVVVTGGEPLLANDLEELCVQLHAAGQHVTLETSAIIDRLVAVDLASISPKLSNSTPADRHLAEQHERDRLNVAAIQAYLVQAREKQTDIQLKFVLEKPQDLSEVVETLASLEGLFESSDVLLMPQAVNRRQLARRSGWVAELCRQHGYRFCTRLQISLYGNHPDT